MNKAICIDFDGTIVSENYPKMGRLLSGAKETINKWAETYTIIISTCRAGSFAEDCRHFLDQSGIKYHFFNENASDRIEHYGTDTRKISADLYFDDRSAGGFMGWKKADAYVDWFFNHKPVIICIVGESGSGKTTLAEYIQNNYGVKMIESYTTRPRRTPDEIGHTFVKDFDLFTMDDMIAYAVFGGYEYCCLKADVRKENTYVIDEPGYDYLRKNFGDEYEIYSIRVRCNAEDRRKRAGEDRVNRDKGKFNLPLQLFDFVWNTDDWRGNSSNNERSYDELDAFINKCLGRGWK